MLIVMFPCRITRTLVCPVSRIKLFNEVVNVKVLLINDHDEYSLLFKLQTLFTELTLIAVSLTMILVISDH